jgi:TetR/AcrR family transcriptional repressor of lmrAB and yxaGH operons
MLRTAGQLFRRQGYAATGWRQVVAESATPWGSQAHHFPGGKTQLAAEAIARAGHSYEEMIRAAFAHGHPADAIQMWADVAADQLAASGWADGCPVATVALETASRSEQLADACASVFRSWRDALADALESRGVDRPDADALAALVLAGIEGALVLARADRNGAPLLLVGGQLATILRERVP